MPDVNTNLGIQWRDLPRNSNMVYADSQAAWVIDVKSSGTGFNGWDFDETRMLGSILAGQNADRAIRSVLFGEDRRSAIATHQFPIF